MAEINSRASLNFYHGANGPTLMFLMYDDADLSGLKSIFLSLAEGGRLKVSLRAAGIVKFASAIDDVVFVRLVDGDEPSRMVRKVQDTIRGPVFEFRRHKEGWLECAELVEGLTGPGHQYLSRGNSDEAQVMLSYGER
ncbi:MAG TPA: hypothetical protein VF860_07860 [Candidatus Acidoferrales bacterium]